MKRCMPLACVLWLVLVACGVGNSSSSATPSPGQPFIAVFVGGFSGGNATTLNAQLAAFRTSAAVLNKNGGILGRPVKVEPIDDQSDPTKATTLLQARLSQMPSPDLVIPGNTSNEALAMLPSLTRNRILTMCSCNATAVNDPATYPYIFSVAWPQDDQAAAIVQYVKSKGYNRIGVLSTADAVGQAARNTYNKAIPGTGLTPTFDQFAAGTVDVTPNLERLKQSNIDALITIGVSQQNPGYVYSSRSKLGWTVPVVSDTGASFSDWTKLLPGTNLNGIVIQVGPKVGTADLPVTGTPAYKAMVSALKSELGGSLALPMALYVQYYNILQVADVAARQAKSTDTASMTKALENLTNQPAAKPYIGVKVIQYSPTNHFAHLAPDDFLLTPVGPIVDGLFQTASQ